MYLVINIDSPYNRFIVAFVYINIRKLLKELFIRIVYYTMDTKLKSFLIETIKNINNDSYKIMDIYKLKYFNETQNRQIEQVELLVNNLPIELINNINAFSGYCGHDKKCIKNVIFVISHYVLNVMIFLKHLQ